MWLAVVVATCSVVLPPEADEALYAILLKDEAFQCFDLAPFERRSLAIRMKERIQNSRKRLTHDDVMRIADSCCVELFDGRLDRYRNLPVFSDEDRFKIVNILPQK